MALVREQDLREDDPNATLIIVLQVTQVPPSEVGWLASYDLLDMTSPDGAEETLRVLAERFESATEPERGRSPRRNSDLPSSTSSNRQEEDSVPPNGVDANGADEPIFRNRVDELHRVSLGLTNAGGPHFWLVVAPPLLGKTWFLRRVSTGDSVSQPIPWVISMVDLRREPTEACSDVTALLELLFARTSSATVEEAIFSIAQTIISVGRPYLCMLDSAELLTEETASSLRESLSQIYRLVQDAGVTGLRLAFIAASRRDDDWKGITPTPRLAPLPLTEFHTDVVEQALHDLADEMRLQTPRLQIPAWRIGDDAIRVHRLTEGLPALLVRCLQWIRENQWVGMERRLEDPRRFEELAVPYIQRELLTPASLLPASQGDSHAQMQALVQAYRVLAPYRLFTQSHLRHHLESDDKFRATLTAAGWAMPDLWKAIGETALLKRPLKEPWQEIHPAIRRLLYRYFYKTEDEREQAHSEARVFVELWADGQFGTEQVIGMVECLWHEAVAVGPHRPDEMERGLTESARKLSGSLRESSAFSLPELRAFAVEQMRNDEELREAVSSVDGLFGRLVQIIEWPGEP